MIETLNCIAEYEYVSGLRKLEIDILFKDMKEKFA